MASEQYLPALTSLRGIAAFLVVLSHLGWHYLLPKSFFYPLGALGVMTFFALSGYLMVRLYLRKPARIAALQEYVAARVSRVYPLFGLVVLLSAATYEMTGIRVFYHLEWEAALRHILLLEGQSVFWTIVVEFKFYAAFLVYWLLFGRLPWFVHLALMAIVIAWANAQPLGNRMALVHGLPMFCWGAVLATLPDAVLRRFRLPFVVASMLAISLAVSVWIIFDLPNTRAYYKFPPIQVSIVFLLISAVAASKHDWISSWRPGLALGAWSFGLYLLHIPVILMFRNLANDISIDPGWFALPAIAFSIWIARLSHEYFEEPARRLLRRMISRPPTKSTLALPNAQN